MESPDWTCGTCGKERHREHGATFCANPNCPECPPELRSYFRDPEAYVAAIARETKPHIMSLTRLLTNGLNDLSQHIFQQNHKWWHDKDGNRLNRNPAELICLMHSELSEAMEGERKDLMDDHLPHRKMVEVELADTIIRILDFCGSRGYDIQGAIEEKLKYNQTRVDHSHEAREAEGGKRF